MYCFNIPRVGIFYYRVNEQGEGSYFHSRAGDGIIQDKYHLLFHMAVKKVVSGKDRILARVARVEGQLRGVRKMIETEQECLDIIAQISAVREAVAMLGVELLKNDVACKWDGKKKIDEAYLKSLFRMK